MITALLTLLVAVALPTSICALVFLYRVGREGR